MRKRERFVDEKIKEIAKEKSVLDIGGGERFQKWLAPYKELFKDVAYKSMDYDPASGADVIGDIHKIPLAENSIDAIICHSVLEHVRDPLLATKELHRILRPGGKIFVHVPSIYPYHARKGSYPDYWRFFDDTLLVMFGNFSHFEIEKRGGYFTAFFFFMPFQHKLRFLIDPVADFLDRIFKTEKRTTTSGYYIYAIK